MGSQKRESAKQGLGALQRQQGGRGWGRSQGATAVGQVMVMRCWEGGDLGEEMARLGLGGLGGLLDWERRKGHEEGLWEVGEKSRMYVAKW